MGDEQKASGIGDTKGTEEVSVISRHLARLEERVRLLHDRLFDVLGPNRAVKTDDEAKMQEASPLCEKIIIIAEFIETIHNKLEV